MKRIFKLFTISFVFLIGFTMMCFPLVFVKSGSIGSHDSDQGEHSGEIVQTNGDFGFVYAKSDVPSSRGVIQGVHAGIDFNGGYGTDVLAICDAVVYKASNTCAPNGGYLGNWCPFDEVSGGGNYVVLTFNYEGKQYYAQYDHMSKVYVKTGDKVKRGQKVGAEGHSGNSTGSHLHFEVHYGGLYTGSYTNLINPRAWWE